MMTFLTICGVIVLVLFVACRFLGPTIQMWIYSLGFCSHSGEEEKIGLSKNGYIVHSESSFDIGIDNAGSFKRFESIEVYSVKSKDEIPPQPLRPAPSGPMTAPIKICKSTPRPVARKQLSAPAATTPSVMSSRVLVQKVQTNPFLNGTMDFEINQSHFFPTNPMTKPYIDFENERVAQSANFSMNTTLNSSTSDDTNVFDFNPKTIRQIFEETVDEGYLGDNDDNEDNPLKKLEERIQKIEAFGRQRRKSEIHSPRFSPKILDKPVTTQTIPPALSSSMNGKFTDSSLNEDNVSKSYRKHVRTRSFSVNESADAAPMTLQDERGDISTTQSVTSKNPFLNGKRLLKTPSETYLEQFSLMRANSITSNVIGKSLPLCKYPSLSSQQANKLQNPTSIKRAASSESISSESSVIFNTLEKTNPPTTGMLGVAIQYDKNSATEEGCELLVTVLEARDLKFPDDPDPDCVDTFVRIYLVPDDSDQKAMQTKIFKNSKNPSFQEQFVFITQRTSVNIKRSLWFHLYHTSTKSVFLIGEAEMKLMDFQKPVTTWLQLSDSRNNCTNYGDIMFSLSYLPTAERLTVVIVKARNLRPERGIDEIQFNSSEIQNVFVKVYLLKNNKKVSKKRTSMKKGERNPIFNEALSYSVPPFLLNSIQVRLTVMNTCEGKNKAVPLGHVIVGGQTDGKGILHWHQMIMSLRKPVAMFHPLRKTE